MVSMKSRPWLPIPDIKINNQRHNSGATREHLHIAVMLSMTNSRAYNAKNNFPVDFPRFIDIWSNITNH